MAKFENLEEFYASLNATQEASIRRFVAFVQDRYPDFDIVLAWNQPMFKKDKHYILGFMPTKGYINLATLSDLPIKTAGELLKDYRHGGRTVSLPFDWQIDTALLDHLVNVRIQEVC